MKKIGLLVVLSILLICFVGGCGKVEEKTEGSSYTLEQLSKEQIYEVLEVREGYAKDGVTYWREVDLILVDNDGERYYVTYGIIANKMHERNEKYIDLATLVKGDKVKVGEDAFELIRQ